MQVVSSFLPKNHSTFGWIKNGRTHGSSYLFTFLFSTLLSYQTSYYSIFTLKIPNLFLSFYFSPLPNVVQHFFWYESKEEGRKRVEGLLEKEWYGSLFGRKKSRQERRIEWKIALLDLTFSIYP